jgi:hypothetical protein
MRTIKATHKIQYTEQNLKTKQANPNRLKKREGRRITPRNMRFGHKTYFTRKKAKMNLQ